VRECDWCEKSINKGYRVVGRVYCKYGCIKVGTAERPERFGIHIWDEPQNL